ncbi:MAG: UDP-3-O-acyl-N-acetylglucosamine deacetylase [Pseudomonadota bacterium]
MTIERRLRSEGQTSLKSSITIEGTALHAGVPVSLTMAPAEAGAGYVFVRRDLNDAEIIGSPETVVETRLGTCIANDAGATVKTIEHLLAAFYIAGVDNARITLTGPEPPILDGSAAGFLSFIDQAGLFHSDIPKRRITPSAPIEVRDGDRFVRFEPSAERRLTVSIDFPDPAIGVDQVTIDLCDAATTRDRLASARTFCRRADIEAMRASGLARGGSLENAVVVDGETILNEGGLRDHQEFALHKALDLVGDLALLGGVLEGAVIAHKPGHDLNTGLAKKIFAENKAAG